MTQDFDLAACPRKFRVKTNDSGGVSFRSRSKFLLQSHQLFSFSASAFQPFSLSLDHIRKSPLRFAEIPDAGCEQDRHDQQRNQQALAGEGGAPTVD